ALLAHPAARRRCPPSRAVHALRGGAGVSALLDSRGRLAGVVAVAGGVADPGAETIVSRPRHGEPSIPLLAVFAPPYVRNSGAAFGVLGAAPSTLRIPLFLGVTLVAAVALVSFLRRASPDEHWLVGALGGILGGAIGNLICRVRFGEVIDFLDLHWRSF